MSFNGRTADSGSANRTYYRRRYCRPRIVGKAVGLHPAVALIALIAGAEVFGIWGAIFASPIAGLLQALFIAIWQDWRMDKAVLAIISCELVPGQSRVLPHEPVVANMLLFR